MAASHQSDHLACSFILIWSLSPETWWDFGGWRCKHEFRNGLSLWTLVHTAELKRWHQRPTIGGLVARERAIWILMRTLFCFVFCFLVTWSGSGWSGFCSLSCLLRCCLLKGWAVIYEPSKTRQHYSTYGRYKHQLLWAMRDPLCVCVCECCTLGCHRSWTVTALTAVHVLTVLWGPLVCVSWSLARSIFHTWRPLFLWQEADT